MGNVRTLGTRLILAQSAEGATKKADALHAKVVGDYIDCTMSNLAYLIFTVGSEACHGGLQR